MLKVETAKNCGAGVLLDGSFSPKASQLPNPEFSLRRPGDASARPTVSDCIFTASLHNSWTASCLQSLLLPQLEAFMSQS